MKKNFRVLILVVFALSIFATIYAQESQEYTREELQKMISEEKRLIRETAKDFLIDTLPGLMESDPEAADQALAQYSGMFNTMDQNDFMYLLGHFYARMGENSKAISSFNSLLKTNLNEDARKMLNLVLYQQMIDYLQKKDYKAAKDFLRAIIFENYNIDRYYPSYLYIWADMSADDGEYETVASTLESYNTNRDTIINKLLPSKQRIIDRVQNLDINKFYLNPTTEDYQKMTSEIESIKVDLTGVYNELISLKGIIYLDAIVRMHEQEMNLLNDLQKTVSDYYNMKSTSDKFMADGFAKLQGIKGFSVAYQKQIAIMDRILQLQYEKFLANDPYIQGKDFSDMELNRLVEIEKSIMFYNDNIAELDKDIADPALADEAQRLKDIRADFSEKLTDLQLRKNAYLESRKHSSDIQEEIFNSILNEYYSLNQDKKDLDIQIAEIEDFFNNDAKTIFDDQMREDIKTRMQTEVAQTLDTQDRNEPIRMNAREMLANVEFIKMQMSYRNIQAKEYARLAQKDNLSIEQMTERQTQILAEKRELIGKIQDFIAANPDFHAIEQPGDTYLITNADLYYNLAELQYAVNLNNPAVALDSYRKVIQLNPNFVFADATLYNIGFISSQLKRNQIDANKNRFYELNKTALALDDASRYKPSDFSEAIEAYQNIVDNHKDSPLYDEALYRMGVLDFYLATDADEPARYYALASNCFNELIDKPNSKYKYDAIYQRGWLRLNSADDQDLKLAMGDFLSLLNAIESKQITDPILVQDYREDAVDNIAYCLIALDGADFSSKAKGVAQLQEVFGNYSNAEIISKVVDKAAKNKFDLSASMQAADYIWLKINMNPLALENPSLVDSILYTYARSQRDLRDGQDFDQVTQDLYQNIITNYGKDSAWYAANKDKPNISTQLAVVNKAFDERSKRLYNEYINDPTNEARMAAYQKHMDQYAAFSELQGEGYAEWQKNNEKVLLTISTMLAEKTNLPKNYMLAISNLYKYNAKYPEDADFFFNEGLAYTYSNNVYSILKDKYTTDGYKAEQGLPANEDELFNMLSTNSQRFVGVLLSDKFRTNEHEIQSNNILLSLADIQYNREKFPEATELYLKALEKESLMENATRFDVFGKLALMAEARKDFVASEHYYRKALAFAQTPAEKAAITSNINVQIQSNYENSEAKGNYSQAADERLRLAQQLSPADTGRIQGLKWAAHESYVRAKEYQKAIDLLLELAGTKTDINEIYAYYYRAWEIAKADTAMNNRDLGETIRNEFISKYPSSNQAYSLRLADIQDMEKNPAQRTAAAEAYLTLFEEARNKSINTGTDTPDAFLVNAGVNYRAAGNKEKEIEVYNKVISLYPKHPNVIPYTEYIADDYLAKGDTLRFEQLAKDIYMKDKTKKERYMYVAVSKLHKLMYAFDTDYKNKNYAEAFKQRDAYKKLEKEYLAEGLVFDTPALNPTQNNDYFAAVQKEYDDIQKKAAFFRNYDNQIAAIEKGAFLTTSAAKHITVNANTKWETNLLGGSTKRIPNFKAALNAEVKKVTKILDQANSSEFDLDNVRRLRAQSLIAKIYAKGSEVITTQVGSYVKISSEAEGARKDYKGDALQALINQVASQQIGDLLDAEYVTRINIFNLYQTAGYTDTYTESNLARLKEWNLVPDYKVEQYPLGSSWTQKIDDKATNLTATVVTSPKGIELGTVTIPANKELIITKMVSAKLTPDIAFLQVVSPYDVKISLNGTDVEAGVVPTDTLDVAKPITTRYAYLLPSTAWAEGQNIVEVKIPNNSPEPQNASINLQMFTSRRRIAEAIPLETTMLYSDTSWRVVRTDPETGQEISSNAIIASNFGITNDQIDGMDNTPAKPIWLSEEAPISPVTFEVDFTVNTDFREGLIDFIAPESVNIYLNGSELSANRTLDYDPEPFRVYSLQMVIDKAKVVVGKNTLRFTVTNSSQYRGFLASVKIVQAGKEEVR